MIAEKKFFSSKQNQSIDRSIDRFKIIMMMIETLFFSRKKILFSLKKIKEKKRNRCCLVTIDILFFGNRFSLLLFVCLFGMFEDLHFFPLFNFIHRIRLYHHHHYSVELNETQTDQIRSEPKKNRKRKRKKFPDLASSSFSFIVFFFI